MSGLGSAFDGLRHEPSHLRRKRLLSRCWHRGTQESDLILGSFAKTSLTGLDAPRPRVRWRPICLT
jgi:succinate dehydrogenase flavin-adding protein (antitoxin of CptAB toxin-antitoxin module)